MHHCCDIVLNSYNTVPTLQRRVALKSSFRIVPCNITIIPFYSLIIIVTELRNKVKLLFSPWWYISCPLLHHWPCKFWGSHADRKTYQRTQNKWKLGHADTHCNKKRLGTFSRDRWNGGKWLITRTRMSILRDFCFFVRWLQRGDRHTANFGQTVSTKWKELHNGQKTPTFFFVKNEGGANQTDWFVSEEISYLLNCMLSVAPQCHSGISLAGEYYFETTTNNNKKNFFHFWFSPGSHGY